MVRITTNFFFLDKAAGFKSNVCRNSVKCDARTMNDNFSNSNEVLQKEEIGVDILQDRDENLAKFEIATLAIIFVITVIGNTIVLLALWTRRR